MTKEELLKAYALLPTGNISDAMSRIGIAQGALVDGPWPLSYTQPRMVGFACTIQQMVRHQSEKEPKLTKHLSVFDTVANPGDVVVIDVGGRMDVCTGGGMGVMRLKQRGISGLVVNGCYRDIGDILMMDFPLFIKGTSPIKSSPMLQTTGVNVPITIGGVQIRPGDLIIGDDTGIVVVPIETAEDVLCTAQHINRVEEYMMQYIEEGLPYPECRNKAEERAKKDE